MAGRQGQTSVEIKKTPMQPEKGYSLGKVLCSIPRVMYVCDVFFSKNAWPGSLSTQPEASLWQPGHYCFEKRLLKASNKDSFLLALVSKETLLCGKSMANGMNKDPGWLLRRPPRHPLIARLVVYIHLTLTCRLPTAGLLSPGSGQLVFPRQHLHPFFCLPSLHQLHCPVTALAFWTFSSHTPLVLTEE